MTVRIGYAYEADHFQWQLEARNPVTSELLALESQPHLNVVDPGDVAAYAARLVREVLLALLDPEPF